MRFRIHRAADEIGGNCVEVESRGQSILLDLGLPLVAGESRPEFLPLVEGLERGGNPDLLGVVVSHPHQDHYGLLASAHPSVPVFIGERARRLLGAASFFTRSAQIRQPITSYIDRKQFTVGPFSITPFQVDHSAFDAYALLIEADGKRLLYSGDFRMHGRKAADMEALLLQPPRDVDVLLMEGTVLGRDDEASVTTEQDLERQISSSLQGCQGLGLAYLSAQNIDRLVTFAKAAEASGRTLVVDAYTACILKALGADAPFPLNAGRTKVYLPKRQKLQIVWNKRFDLVEPFKASRIYLPELAAHQSKYVMLFRTSMQSDLEGLNLSSAKLFYSLWPGYLARDGAALMQWASDRNTQFEIHHTSGHAHKSDLVRFAEAVNPTVLVPIHTLRPASYGGLFPRVRFSGSDWQDV